MKFDTVRNRHRKKKKKRLCEERGRDKRKERGIERVMWSQAKTKQNKTKPRNPDSYQELKEGRKHAPLKPSEGGQCCIISLISDFWFHKMMGEYIPFI